MPKYFSNIYKILSSRFNNYFFCDPEHKAQNLDFRPPFPRLFWDFRKWTFINVQN